MPCMHCSLSCRVIAFTHKRLTFPHNGEHRGCSESGTACVTRAPFCAHCCPTRLPLHRMVRVSVSPREMLVVRFPHSSLVALAATYLVLGGSSVSTAEGESAGPDPESRSDSQSHSDQDPERNTELLVIAPMTDELARPCRPPVRRVGREVIGGVAYAAVGLGISAPFVDYRPMGYVAGISAVLFLSYAAFAYLSVALGRWQWREEHDRQVRALAVVQRERLARVLDVWGLDGAAASLEVDDLVQGTIRAVAWQTPVGGAGDEARGGRV